MNALPVQIQIVGTVVNEFLLVTDNQPTAKKVLAIVLKYVEGNANQATTRCEVRNTLAEINQQVDDDRLNLCIDTAHGLAWGYLHWIQGQQNPDELDFYPALRLFDCYHHAESVDWVARWRDSGGQIFAGNEMVALRNDPVWAYISAFGLPFPPFDLDSGMDVEVVSRKEAQELGLISPNQQVAPVAADLNFGPALRQRLAEHISPEVQKQKLEIAMQQASASTLLELAQERLDSLDEVTAESAPEVVMLLEKSLERGFGEQVSQQASACGILVDVLEAVGESERANFYREQHLQSLEAWIAKGIPIEWNQRSNTYGLAADICESLNRQEQASAYRQLQMENRDGFTLLNEALEKLKACGQQIPKEVGAEILDCLTKAAERIPQKYPERHAEIFRATGEILEAWGDTTQAVEYYEFAIQKNPKVGVKRRLDNLRKSLGGASASGG